MLNFRVRSGTSVRAPLLTEHGIDNVKTFYYEVINILSTIAIRACSRGGRSLNRHVSVTAPLEKLSRRSRSLTSHAKVL
jgi:hypothetical protein